MPLPEWLAEVFQKVDADLAAVRKTEQRRAPSVTKKFAGAVVHKTYENPPVQRVDKRPVMDAATAREWDEWCDSRIRKVFDPDSGEMGYVLAEVISLLRQEWREDFEKKLGELRAEMNVLTGIQRGELKRLITSDVPLRRRDDIA